MPKYLVWIGLGIYLVGWVLENPIILISSSGLCVWGLIRYHREKRHPAHYGIIAALLVLLPIFGPLIGLAIGPKTDKKPL